MTHSKLRAIENLSSKDQSRPECYLCGKRDAGYMEMLDICLHLLVGMTT